MGTYDDVKCGKSQERKVEGKVLVSGAMKEEVELADYNTSGMPC